MPNTFPHRNRVFELNLVAQTALYPKKGLTRSSPSRIHLAAKTFGGQWRALARVDISRELVLEDNAKAAFQIDRFHLVGKILSDKILKKTGIIQIAKSSWSTRGKFSISAWGDNVYVINFELEDDCTKILEASPWAFMGYMMNLKRWDPIKSISEIDFSRCLFWIQIHNLPIPKRSESNIEKIAEVIRKLDKIDIECVDCPFNRIYVRVRLEVEVNKPFVRGFSIKREGLPSMWIPL
ncbi:hypothetical protein LguiB_010061 [Lonicera macranthoides]